MTVHLQRQDRPTRRLGRGRLLIVGVALVGATALSACDVHNVQTQDACSALSEKGAPALPKQGNTPPRLDEVQQKCN